LQDGVWVDDSWRAGMEEKVVAAWSDAYFKLLATKPELAEFFALGEAVVVVLGESAYRVEPAEP
jgi:hypothetical protein